MTSCVIDDVDDVVGGHGVAGDEAVDADVVECRCGEHSNSNSNSNNSSNISSNNNSNGNNNLLRFVRCPFSLRQHH